MTQFMPYKNDSNNRLTQCRSDNDYCNTRMTQCRSDSDDSNTRMTQCTHVGQILMSVILG